MTTIAGPGKEVSEKSLELNVCSEMLQYIRAWPGCQRALWLGLTQRQERRTGLDELIRNVGPGSSLMLQFKAPWPNSDVDDLYKFSINERQHETLEQLADLYPEAVYYVFPLYSKWFKQIDMRLISPKTLGLFPWHPCPSPYWPHFRVPRPVGIA